ncbi:MAG: efflux RND transporter permease subunit [Bacteroidaceae bacterium]|nr:efflux RND transporter permease subunit [Bacteroidaceae bacterium]
MNARALTEFFVKRPIIFWSFVVGILVMGVFSYINMPKLEDPAVAIKQASVALIYPGATAHEVELEAVQVMEDELRTLADVKELNSECHPNMAIITVKFQDKVKMAEMEQHFDQLRRKANDVQSKLPSGCYAPIVVDDMLDVYGLFYAFMGDGYSYAELEKYAKLVRRELLTVKGVKRINIIGTRPEVINIIIDKEKLVRTGILPTQVMLGLQNAGKTVSAGNYENGDDRLQLRVNNELEDEKDIADMYIRTPSGKLIRLGDIAKVERSYKEPQTKGFFVNGKPSLGICITLSDDAIVPDVGKKVDKKLAEVMDRVPVGFETEKIFFQADQVTNAVNGFLINLLESVLIVIVVLMFSYGFRGGMIIGTSLILAIFVSFPILLMVGSTLQRISLGAFIVAMGMLVDNAIVVMDGILVDKKKGLGPKSYLYNIVNNTALPMLGATVIAVLTFWPTYISKSTAGEYCRDLFLVLCISLLASWVMAMVQVPSCVVAWLPLRPKAKDKAGENEVKDTKLQAIVRKLIAKLIDFRYTTIGVALVLLAICGFGFTKVKQVFFPDFDYGQFVVEYYLPDQTSPDRVREDLLEITDTLLKNPKIDRVTAAMGSSPTRYSFVRPMNTGGNNYGEMIIDCKDFKTMKAAIKEIRPQLRAAYPDAYIRFRNYNFSITTTHTVEAVFQGPDPEVLRDLAHQAEGIMRKSKYADAYSVQNNWQPKGKSIVTNYVQTDALRSGLSRENVANALLAATDGLPVGIISDQDKKVIVQMQVRNEDGSKIQNISTIPVWSMLNLHITPDDFKGLLMGITTVEELENRLTNSVPLSTVNSDIHLEWEEDYILRRDGQRTIEAECDPNPDLEDATPKKVMADIKDAIEAIELPQGYSLSWEGESSSSGNAAGSIISLFPLAFVFILVIMLLLFNSWKQVLIVVFCLPFILVGIVPALLFMGVPFTFIAILGAMGLVGMMIKNGIVLIDEINRLRREEKLPAYDAIVNATVSRTSPVIMASLTTILGMAPLVPDPMYGSMAVCVMSGLAMGTLITLVFLPILYSTIFKVQKTKAV